MIRNNKMKKQKKIVKWCKSQINKRKFMGMPFSFLKKRKIFKLKKKIRKKMVK